jgi:hypothetical protein
MKSHFLMFAVCLFSLRTGLAQSPGTFTPTGDLTVKRQFHTATLLTTGKVLITGGWAVLPEWPVWSTAELYNPATGKFTATGNMTGRRAGHTATLLPNGKVLIAGGWSVISDGAFGGFARTAEIYDPETGVFTATGEMTRARGVHSATLLNNGKVLVVGNGPNLGSSTAELYDPVIGTFAVTGETVAGRGDHTATLLSSGKVLVEGGRSVSSDQTVGNEIYDPDTGKFTPTAGKANPYVIPVSSTLLPSGKVLVTEQYSCDPSEYAELYDPATETSTATGKLTKQRGFTTSTLLPEGRVFIAGRDYVRAGGSAEFYDPAAGIFSAPTAMHTSREEGQTATLLPDGNVLLAGGWICCGYSVGTAEIYHPLQLVRSPVLLSLSGDGKGSGAILHAGTHQVVSPGNPAVGGEALEIYLTGLSEGSAIPPQVSIGGRLAEVLYFGKAPGFSELNQVNVRVPAGVTPSSSIGVRMNYLSRPSNEVTIAVR